MPVANCIAWDSSVGSGDSGDDEESEASGDGVLLNPISVVLVEVAEGTLDDPDDVAVEVGDSFESSGGAALAANPISVVSRHLIHTVALELTDSRFIHIKDAIYVLQKHIA